MTESLVKTWALFYRTRREGKKYYIRCQLWPCSQAGRWSARRVGREADRTSAAGSEGWAPLLWGCPLMPQRCDPKPGWYGPESSERPWTRERNIWMNAVSLKVCIIDDRLTCHFPDRCRDGWTNWPEKLLQWHYPSSTQPSGTWTEKYRFNQIEAELCVSHVGRVSQWTNLQMLSMAMSRSCSYIEGWLFLLEWALRVDWECSLVTWILISLPP